MTTSEQWTAEQRVAQWTAKQTAEQRTTPSHSLSRGGWMLNSGSSRHVQRSGYANAASKKRGWMLNTAAPLSKRSSERVALPSPSAVLGHTPSATSEATVIGCEWLSAYQVDALAEKGRDWISLLPGDWQLEISNAALLGIADQGKWSDRLPLSVEELVKITQQAHYYSLSIAGETYWSYTCCLQISELDRVRFVVCFREGDRGGQYAALITNRLDWSPRKIISQCLPLGIWPDFGRHDWGGYDRGGYSSFLETN